MDIDLFPFPEKREKQEDLIETAEEVMENGENLVAHAPTGMGKCVSRDTIVLTGEGFRNIEEFDFGKTVEHNSFDGNLKN